MSWAHAGHAQLRLPLQCDHSSTGGTPQLFGEETSRSPSSRGSVSQPDKLSGRLNAVIVLQFSTSCSLNQLNHKVPNKQLSWLYLKHVSFKENPPLLPFHSQLSSSTEETQKIFCSINTLHYSKVFIFHLIQEECLQVIRMSDFQLLVMAQASAVICRKRAQLES